MKLGRLPRKENPRTLKLAKYFKIPAPLAAWGWEYNLPNSWGVMMNDTVGDCTCACIGHMIMEWTSRTFGLITPTDQQIIAAYSAITGYVPGDESTDNGAAITDVLAYFVSTGIADRKALAWAEIDVTNLTAIKQAIQIFGGIDIGFNVPRSAMNEFNAGQPWNTVTDTNIVGGHSVCVLGAGGLGCTCITWGKRQSMSWDFFSKFCDEAYALVTIDWLTAASKTPIFGFDLPTLQADLAALKQ
jgi:hypothetical protein